MLFDCHCSRTVTVRAPVSAYVDTSVLRAKDKIFKILGGSS